jgi:hypothetical protein
VDIVKALPQSLRGRLAVATHDERAPAQSPCPADLARGQLAVNS